MMTVLTAYYVVGLKNVYNDMSWSPVKGFSLFLFLVQKSVIPAPKDTTTSHRFIAAILYITQNNSHSSPQALLLVLIPRQTHQPQLNSILTLPSVCF